MKAKLQPLLSLLFLAMLVFPAPARADGIIIPDPPFCQPCPPPPCPGPAPCPIPSPIVQLVIRSHHVHVSVVDQVAVTRVDQIFFNPNEWAVEGLYLFPLPLDAAVSSFTLWVDGQAVQGEILEAEAARQKYREITANLRDPALLEYAGRGAVQAHIFPIPPQGERRIQLEYTQALTAENGLVRYIYPLNTEKFSLWPLEQVSITVDIRSQSPLRAVYSPSHSIAAAWDGEQYVTASYEEQNVLPASDFALYYSIGESQAFHLLTFRSPEDAGDPDGFFLLLLAPSPQNAAAPQPKDLLLVLDRSGSMDGEKFFQAQEALRYILSRLNPDDRFNVITFSTGLESYARLLRPASEAAEAAAWVGSLSASGATDINRALLEAAAVARRGAEAGRPTYLIFLTDGLPTEGEIDSDRILKNLAQAAPAGLRLFPFGVGYDVDTFLLDSLAQAHHGLSTYVQPGERLDEVLSAFYTRISTPVLTDLELDFGGLDVYDLYPSPLPDLFKGSQVVLVGRYRQGGEATVRLEGMVSASPQVFTYPGQVFAAASQPGAHLDALPRLWATRKIGYLLNYIRLHGPDQETIDQIVGLSIRYGIVTPYTSYLVTEDAPLGAAAQGQIAADQYKLLQGAPAPAFGQMAVERADQEGRMAGADAPLASQGEAQNRVRIVGARTFVLADGKWVDTAFDPGQMTTVPVEFLSSDYFELAEALPSLGAAFALGEAVIAMSGGTAYEVLPAGAQVPPLDVPVAQPLPTASLPAPAATPPPAPAAGSVACPGLLAPLLLLILALALPRSR
jgi:Ca-activated chloride channel homolog